jgi:imidazolonepropionase-like amidohydrolase
MPRPRTSPSWLLPVAAGLTALSTASAAVAQAPPTRWGPDSTTQVLVHARIFDGTGTAVRSDMVVVVRDARIADVFPAGTRTPPSDARVIDVSGRWIIPGLIDGHVHLATEPDGEDSRERARGRLRSALYGGVTTVRDMAGDTRRLADLARDALVGASESPHIYYAALMAGPAFFKDPRTASSARGLVAGHVPWMRAVTPDMDFARVVAEAHGTGATALKLYAMLTPDEVERLCAEAHRQGMRVWAHANLDPAGPLSVVQGGANAVSHASMLTAVLSSAELRTARRAAEGGETPELRSPALDTLFATMRARGTIFEPTLFIYGTDNARERLAAAITRAAYEAGVTLMAGTDSMGAPALDALPNLHRELAALVEEAGLSPADALVAATRNAAEAIGIGKTAGTVEPGKAADLVVLDEDPLVDIHNTTRIDFVMKAGRIFRRSAADGSSPPGR